MFGADDFEEDGDESFVSIGVGFGLGREIAGEGSIWVDGWQIRVWERTKRAKAFH